MRTTALNSRFIILSFITSLSSISFAANNLQDFSDWHSKMECRPSNPNERNTTILCNGCYQEPNYPLVLSDKETLPTKITANSGEFISKGDSTFLGNVVAKQGNRTIYADRATIHHDETTGELQSIHAIGNFRLTEPGMRIDGSKAEVNYADDKKVIHNANFRLYGKHLRGQAKTITTFGKTKLLLPRSNYTTCAPGQNSWQLHTKKSRFNRDTGRGEAWHATLYVKNIPIFYWPYMNFPIDDRRQTGFLQPSYSHSSIDGDTITVPYYLNLAPNYDATITPNLMSHRKLKLDNRVRYLTADSYGKIQFNYLPSDKAYKHFVTESLANPGLVGGTTDPRYLALRDSNRRYGMSIMHHSDLQKNLFLDIAYTRVGDDNYVYDFGNDFRPENIVDPSKASLPTMPKLLGQEHLHESTALLQQAMLTYRNQFGNLTARTSQYQSLHPFLGPRGNETYRRLPELDFQSTQLDLAYNFEANATANYTAFKMRDLDFIAPLTTGQRYHARPALLYPYSEPGWFIKPRVQYDVVSYHDLHLSPADQLANKPTTKTRGIPLYDLDAGLIFERPLALNHTKFSQTLEPRIYYLYVPDRDQADLPIFDSSANSFDYNQIFRDNRYSGRDRVGDDHHISLGIFNRLLTDDIGQEKASFGIGRIFYLRDRTLHLPDINDPHKRWSPLAAIASYQVDPDWSVNASMVREHLNRTQSSSLTAQYQPSPVQVVNVGYQFTRNDNVDPTIGKPLHLRATKLSSAWALTTELRLLGKLDYDLNLRRSSDMLLGMELHSCCTVTRIAWGKKRKPSSSLIIKESDYVLLLQLVFKGLGGTNNTHGILRGMIPGYTPNDHAF